MTNPTPWQLVADEVLAAMIHSAASYERARYELGAMTEHFPPGHYQTALKAVDITRMGKAPMHITTIHADSGAPLDWLSDRFVLAQKGAKLNGAVLTENVKRLKQYGNAYAQIDAMRWGAEELTRAESVEDRAQVIGTVVTRLGLDASEDVQDACATAAAARFEQLLDAEPQPTLITGVPWLTEITGGIGRGHIWWIAAAYKRRKSTLLRIMALALAEAGISVTICALEGTQAQWIADFVSMLAVRWLHANDHWDKKHKGVPLHAISSTLLFKLGNRYKLLHPLKVQAISEGVKAYRALGDRLRIYDSQPKNGALNSLASVETAIKRDIARYKTEVVFVDHLQLISAGKNTEFENVTESARRLQHMAASQDIALVVLAQLNEEAVKFGPRTHSPGIKGGGAPAATADFILRTGYPTLGESGDEDKTRLQIDVGFARRGSEGGSESFEMHPPTGWLIPTTLHTTADPAAGLQDVAKGGDNGKA